METLEIPQFTLAKVGPRREKDKERKKGGAWFWLNGGGAGTGGIGGLGAGAGGGGFAGLLGLSGLAAKALVVLVLGGLALSAYNLGRSLAPVNPDETVRAFVPREKPADEGLAASAGASPASGLSMVSGSLTDGAGAAPDAGAAAGAGKDPAAGAAPESAAAPAAAIPIPAATAPPATAPPALPADPVAAAGKFSAKFGQLSTAPGGGTAYPTLAGGSGLSTGSNGKFDPGALGKAHVFSKPSSSHRAATRPSVNGRRDRAFSQLKNASNLSRAGSAAGGTETASTSADMPFSNNPAVGTVVTGGGAGSQNTSGAGAGADGGPVGNNNGGATQDPGNANGKNATPWSNQARQAAGALLVASILIGIAKFLPTTWAMIALAIAAMLGAFAMGLGNQVSAMGGGPQGKLLVAGGAAAMGGAGLGAAGNAVSSAVMVWTGVASGLLAGVIGAKGLMGKLN